MNRSAIIDNMMRLTDELDVSIVAFEMTEDEHSDEGNEDKISAIKMSLSCLNADIGDLVP